MSQKPIVIIGSGLAGYTVIREFRKLENEVPVLILSADHGGFYSKPMLSNALATGKTPDTLLNNSAEHMAEQMKVVIRPYSTVSAINPSNKNLILQDGEKIDYDQLVLALGANQIRLPLEGDGTEEILSVNNLDDYRRFRDTLTTKKEIAILGAGLIGCEFANDLAVAGYNVHVIDISTHPLGRLLPLAGGVFLQRKLETTGVVFHFDTITKRVEKIGKKLGLFFISLASRFRRVSTNCMSARSSSVSIIVRSRSGSTEPEGWKISGESKDRMSRQRRSQRWAGKFFLTKTYQNLIF